MGKPCSEKVAYLTEEDAAKALDRIRLTAKYDAADKARLTVYPCRKCGLHHIGKINPNPKEVAA